MPFIPAFYGTCEDGTGGAEGAGNISPPGAVTMGPASSISTSQIDLGWLTVSGATSYKIERSIFASSGFSQIATTTNNSYSSTGLLQGTRYYYRVRATNGNGDGPYSNTVNNFTRPGQVVNLSATAASSSQINLSWTNPFGTETGFQIWRSTNSNMAGQILVTTLLNGSATSYSNTGLSASTTFYYRVRAQNSGGIGAYSSVVNATTQASSGGSAPTGVSIATSSSGNYNNALIIKNIAIGTLAQNPVVPELGGNFSSNAVTMTLNYGPDYEAALNNNSGTLVLLPEGYIRATGATSFQWDMSNASVNQDTGNAINSLTISGTASTNQDATGSGGIGEKLNIIHNSGGRGYLMLRYTGDNISFDVDADATNSGGTTAASTLSITLGI